MEVQLKLGASGDYKSQSEINKLARKFAKGFEQNLLLALDRLSPNTRSQGTHLVAQLTYDVANEKSEYWTSGYGKVIEVDAGQHVILSTYVRILIAAREFPHDEPVLYSLIEPMLSDLYAAYMRSPSQFGHYLLQACVWGGAKHQRLRVGDEIADAMQLIEKKLAERRMYNEYLKQD